MYPFSTRPEQHGGGGGGSAAVGIRQPQVEGKHGAFDTKASYDQTDGYRQCQMVATGSRQLRHCFCQGGHQQIAGDAVEKGQADQKQARSQQAHKEVADRGDQIGPVVLGHDQGAGGDGADLNEHVAGKHVVGVSQRQQRRRQQIHHDEVKPLFFRQDVMKQVPPSAHQRHGQHHTEYRAQQSLQRPAFDGVSIGSHEPAHGIGEAQIAQVGIGQHRRIHDCGNHGSRQCQAVGGDSPAQ